MNKKCIIFDLDGTLIESLQGILDACNLTFKELGLNIHKEYEEAKHFIGAGATEFARRALGDVKLSKEKEEEAMNLFLKKYGETQVESAKPFPGITEGLKELKKHNYHLCIASNKPQVLLEPLIKQLFPEGLFDIAMGQIKGAPEKPDPFIVNDIIKKLGVSKDECIYVGDSQYDVETAINAGLESVIVKYGYGFYNEPWVKKATYLVDSIPELIKLLN